MTWSRRWPAGIERVPAGRFFFYGTLMAGSGNPLAEAVHRKLGPGVPAAARGELRAIDDADGWYPAFREDPAGGRVHGFVHEAGPGFGMDDLARLDAYEACTPERPGESEYHRCAIAVTLDGGETAIAQAYVYARAWPAASVAIPSGNFAAFLKDGGRRGFGARA